MTKFLSVALALIVSTTVAVAQSAENYHVVRVVGKVQSTQLKRTLKTEDVISNNDQLTFGAPQDYIIIFNPKSGRKRIQGVPDAQPREIGVLLGSFLKPDEKNTATRSFNQEYLDALKSSLQDTVLILGDGVIELDPASISLKQPATIKAEYKGDGKKAVMLVISDGQTIRLGKKTLFPNLTGPTPKVLLLYFLKNSNSTIESEDFLGHFVPLYVDDATVLPEVKAICASMKGSTSKDIEEQVAVYLTNEYAKPQPLNLHSWMKSHRLLPEE